MSSHNKVSKQASDWLKFSVGPNLSTFTGKSNFKFVMVRAFASLALIRVITCSHALNSLCFQINSRLNIDS